LLTPYSLTGTCISVHVEVFKCLQSPHDLLAEGLRTPDLQHLILKYSFRLLSVLTFSIVPSFLNFKVLWKNQVGDRAEAWAPSPPPAIPLLLGTFCVYWNVLGTRDTNIYHNSPPTPIHLMFMTYKYCDKRVLLPKELPSPSVTRRCKPCFVIAIGDISQSYVPLTVPLAASVRFTLSHHFLQMYTDECL
jgi:hypothetical protein